MSVKRVALVVPVFNEGSALGLFHTSLTQAVRDLPYEFLFLYVNDGSTDDTSSVLAEISRQDGRVSYLTLSRNFGHQAALSAGLDHADADAVIMMDGDGQHPPHLLPAMLQLFEQGFDVVQMRRVDAPSRGSLFKRWTSGGFYWLLNRIGDLDLDPGAADFRLISRDVATALRSLREYHRFLRGMTSWLGFRRASLAFHPEPRLAGHAKYSVRKMLRLAGDGLFSFSLLPLRTGILFGMLFLALASAEILYVSVYWLFLDRSRLVPGWSSLIIITTLGIGVIMILLGFIGVYVGMIFQEVKRRPVYLLKPSECHVASGLQGARSLSRGS